DKADIGAGFQIGVDAVDRGLQTLDRPRIRPGDDDQIGVLPGIGGGADLADHLAEADDLLALVMPAFFGRELVLDVERGDPRLLVFADRADHVDCVAVAGIGIGDDRDADRLDRQPDKADILRQGKQAEIGIAVGPRISASRQIDRFEPGLLDEPRPQRVIGSRHHRVAATGNQGSHSLSWRHRALLQLFVKHLIRLCERCSGSSPRRAARASRSFWSSRTCVRRQKSPTALMCWTMDASYFPARPANSPGTKLAFAHLRAPAPKPGPAPKRNS